MAQSKVLLRFRARLRSRGYQDIKIKRCAVDYNADFDNFIDGLGFILYKVTCIEPLCGWKVSFFATEPQMANWPGIEFEYADFNPPISFSEFDGSGDDIFV